MPQLTRYYYSTERDDSAKIGRWIRRQRRKKSLTCVARGKKMSEKIESAVLMSLENSEEDFASTIVLMSSYSGTEDLYLIKSILKNISGF